MLARFDEAVELDVSAISPFQATYRGHEGIRSYFEEMWDVASAFAFDVEEAVEVGDCVVVTVRVRVVGAGSGAEVVQTYGVIWRIVDSKVAEIRLYPEPAQAREAAGL